MSRGLEILSLVVKSTQSVEPTMDDDDIKSPRSSMSARSSETGEPLDFSFCELLDVADLEGERPRAGRTRAMIEADRLAKAKQEEEAVKEKQAFTLEKPRRTSVALPVPVTTVLKLNNNYLKTVVGLDVVLPQLLDAPFNLTMLDLSFNEIESIDDVLLQFQNLSVFYLHGNKINCSLSAVDKLANLPRLRSFTLHGNPIEQKKDYRLYAIGILPTLKTLDFTTITTRDRERAAMVLRAKASRKPRSEE